MVKVISKYLLIIFILSALGAPLLAAAQAGNIPRVPPSQTSVGKFLTDLQSWLIGLLLVVAAIFIVIAAFYYLTSGGDQEKVTAANKMLLYAVVAVAVALLSFAIIKVAVELVG